MDDPVLAVDIDGVVILVGEDGSGSLPVQFALVDGMMRSVSLGAGDCLRRLSPHYELVWASGWDKHVGQHLSDLLGIPRLPHLDFGRAAHFGSADWKFERLDSYSRGRPMAWLDDCLDERCTHWAEARSAPTKLIPIDPARGLEEPHVDELIEWAEAL